MTNSTGTLNVKAFADTRWEDGDVVVAWDSLSHLEITADFETREEAEAFAALFPKSAKIRVTSVTTFDGRPLFWAVTRVGLRADGVNGGTNETGVKRYRSILRAAAKNGVEVVWVTDCANSFATQDDFEALLP